MSIIDNEFPLFNFIIPFFGIAIPVISPISLFLHTLIFFTSHLYVPKLSLTNPHLPSHTPLFTIHTEILCLPLFNLPVLFYWILVFTLSFSSLLVFPLFLRQTMILTLPSSHTLISSFPTICTWILGHIWLQVPHISDHFSVINCLNSHTLIFPLSQ